MGAFTLEEWNSASGTKLLLLLVLVMPTRGSDCRANRVVLSAPSGNITDGKGNYSANGGCEWLIRAPRNEFIILKFTAMETECSYDFLFVYDGQSYNSPLIASLSGNTFPDMLVARSGKMLMHLFSDANYNLAGFSASYFLSHCDRNCSDRGRCLSDGRCFCLPGWVGDACEAASCILPTHYIPCSGHGKCLHTGLCECEGGEHIGSDCSLDLHGYSGVNQWHLISGSHRSFPARLGAAAVFLKATNSLYVFGGFTLNDVVGDLVKFNFTSNQWENYTPPISPEARYQHSLSAWLEGFLLFGGAQADGVLLSDLWFYSPESGNWSQLWAGSQGSPPGLASHAAALVNDSIYIFGGRTSKQQFSSELYKFNLSTSLWEHIVPLGGRRKAVLGHSMVFYPDDRLLLVYGGHHPISTRFSSRAANIFVYHLDLQYWVILESQEGPCVPDGRAFHTALRMGDYMVVYGGNVHTHSGEEKCYDDQVYFYNLRCHYWVENCNTTRHGHVKLIRGRFSHVAAVMNEKVMLVAGGYNGLVQGDLVAYKVPVDVIDNAYTPESKPTMAKHAINGVHCCLKEPQRIIQEQRCQGMHHLLHSCHACLAFGQSYSANSPGPFGWCVQLGRCLLSKDADKCYVNPEQNITGWWGDAATFVTSFEDCMVLDYPPGVHLMKYFQPRNDSQPDEVSISRTVNASIFPVFMTRVQANRLSTNVTALFRGFIHPLSVRTKLDESLKLFMVVRKVNARLWLCHTPNSTCDDTLQLISVKKSTPFLEDVATMTGHLPQLFPQLARGNRYLFIMEAQQDNISNQESSVELKWNGGTQFPHQEILPLFLEPFKSTNCQAHSTCLACLSDQGCGWCLSNAICMPREHRLVNSWSCQERGKRTVLLLQPDQCTLCLAHTDCHTCTQEGICEWLKSELTCTRRGRFPDAIKHHSKCLPPCYLRETCANCLSERSECAWCLSTNSCFPFSIYLGKYPHGECRDWQDSITSQDGCPDCHKFDTCRQCIGSFQCGWCGNVENPILGRCILGDFSGQAVGDCSFTHGGWEQAVVQWSYTSCPDVDECLLLPHNCHHNAICINTPESYICQCSRGYEGDGVNYCNKTCYNECKHGYCSYAPEYKCVCDLGWTTNQSLANDTGVGCDVDCGCFLHSYCPVGLKHCIDCKDWTTGPFCEFCKPGSYGNATSPAECKPCTCNGHEDASKGFCDMVTGTCYCTGHTDGTHCEHCQAGFYGDPRTCEVIWDSLWEFFTGSRRENALPKDKALEQRWKLPIGRVANEPVTPSVLLNNIVFRICREVFCHRWEVVYDSLRPNSNQDLARMGEILDFQLIIDRLARSIKMTAEVIVGQHEPCQVVAERCHTSLNPIEGAPTWGVGRDEEGIQIVRIMAVYVEGSIMQDERPGNFSVSYYVHTCSPKCSGSQICSNGSCTCPFGFAGTECEKLTCSNRCTERYGVGRCNRESMLCECEKGYFGIDCNLKQNSSDVMWDFFVEFPNVQIVHTHLQVPKVRRWHRVVRSALGTWPDARYHHAAAALLARNSLLVVGGITQAGVQNDFWIFDMGSHEWIHAEEVGFLPRIAGHTLTEGNELLLLIGGYSPEDGYNDKVFEYKMHEGRWRILDCFGACPSGSYGHTTAYHTETNTFYVFGGHRHNIDYLGIQSLYILHYPSSTWTVMPSSQDTKLLPRYFHSAAIVQDTMVLFSGRNKETFGKGFFIYNIPCNAWVNASALNSTALYSFFEIVTPVLATVSGGDLFIAGTLKALDLTVIAQLHFPMDPCMLITDDQTCKQFGCSFDETSKNGIESSCFRSINCSQRPIMSSPEYCYSLKSCNECLSVHPSLNNGVQVCKWCAHCALEYCTSSENECSMDKDCPLKRQEVQNCLSPSYSGIRCIGGSCGLVISGSSNNCPVACSAIMQCSACLKQSDCGWCAIVGLNGAGKCKRGNMNGPHDEQCSIDEMLLHAYQNMFGDNGFIGEAITLWAYKSCPPENECRSRHHNCDETEDCVDLIQGFRCICKAGYVFDSIIGKCKPVCKHDCGYGVCIHPDVCHCHFGYTGSNCSTECLCNKHSNCPNETSPTVCTECLNNTKGQQCELCESMHVGSALNGGACEPCFTFCHGNSEICTSHKQYEQALQDAKRFPLSKNKITKWVHEGPLKEIAVCVNCQNNSQGDRCEGCSHGYFLLNGICTKCQCNGHSDICDRNDGTSCLCQNNTETSCLSGEAQKVEACWKHQCTLCKEAFLGIPTEGRHCYRKIAVGQEHCFDPTTQNNCYNEQIRNLRAGQALFFAIQPKFTNVDIRITIDITFGTIDLYISNSYSTFTVHGNRRDGKHEINIEAVFTSTSRTKQLFSRRQRDANNHTGGDTALQTNIWAPKLLQLEQAKGLITFVKVKHQDTIVIIQNVQNRAVVTFPHEVHSLRTQTFYMIAFGAEGHSHSQGFLFFRQDQVHIDLFVFFSVFFSCFFLFLSACALLWKLKHYLQMHRERQQQIIEMSKMASRPFAKITVYMDFHTRVIVFPTWKRTDSQFSRIYSHPHVPDVAPWNRKLLTPVAIKKSDESRNRFRPGWLSLEPTGDGLAAVATVLMQLPGGSSTPCQVCLASALIAVRYGAQERAGHTQGSTMLRKTALSADNMSVY
uniref:multiple epidermal growth factor-like domains protein 8 n=1 Tax=Myxine glutinosa TaxID=7769 RepID=UPI00358F442D